MSVMKLSTSYEFLPKNLGELPVPSQTTDMKSAELHQIFSDLDTRIMHLSRKIEGHRKYGQSEEKVSTSSRCSLICKKLKGSNKLRCIDQCSQPVLSFEKVEDMANDFPIDVQRLRTDLPLREVFTRHQRAPETIRNTDPEASWIVDIYSMPISTLSQPEEAWDRAMDVMKRPERSDALDALVQNWMDRARNYTPESQDELARKIRRHDSGHIIADAISRKSSDVSP
jgi:hypothetical protein